MKKIILTLLLLIGLSFISYSQLPTDFSLWGGYSWLQGVAGAELQMGNIGISGGWFPAKMPMTENKVNSFSGVITFYGRDNDYLNGHSGAEGACYYASIGIASAGYREERSDGYSAIKPMTIAMLGVKSYSDKLQFRIGAGYGFSDYANSFTWEIGFSYALFSSHSY